MTLDCCLKPTKKVIFGYAKNGIEPLERNLNELHSNFPHNTSCVSFRLQNGALVCEETQFKMTSLKELDKIIDTIPEIEFIPINRWMADFFKADKRKRGRMLRKKWKQEKENGKTRRR